MNKEMYGVLCESDLGLDSFGNPKGKPIMLELVGDQMEYSSASERARKFAASGQFGRVMLVRIVVEGEVNE